MEKPVQLGVYIIYFKWYDKYHDNYIAKWRQQFDTYICETGHRCQSMM